ncbi:MAG: NAD-dependent epimerase/dehydratase family protein [Kofleriaceae bacterium]
MILVTGAAGSLGRAIVDRLVEAHPVRAFVRRVPAPHTNVETAVGDLADADAVDRAIAGCDIVVHAGATMKGDWADHERGTIQGTANVLASCAKHGVKQLVYISSMSVIDWAGSDQQRVDEATALEPRADERGHYTRAKLAAEKLVTASNVPHVILRPGQIFGGGIPLINGAVARHAAGRWIVLGDGSLELPLVYIDDVVDAIVACIDRQITNETIQLIDPTRVTQADVLAAAGGHKKIVHIPRTAVFAIGRLTELPLRLLGKPSPIASYRMKSALARLRYESDRAHRLLGWQPRVGVHEGMRRVSS